MKYDLYLEKSSFPRSNPPDQNTISPVTNKTVEIIILTPFSRFRKGITGIARKNGTETIIRINPNLNFSDFFMVGIAGDYLLVEVLSLDNSNTPR